MLAAFALLAATPLPEQVGRPPAGASAEAIVAETEAYFSDRDAGRDAAAYARLAPSLTAYLPVGMWSAEAARFRETAGRPGGRTVSRLTWYADPPGVAPGAYVAADYTGRFANLRLMCGYVMWHREPDGRWRIVREEQNILDERTARQLPPERLKPLPEQFGCPA